MTRRIWIPVMAVVLGLAAGLACGDDGGPTGPVAGSLTVSLTTPNADDGAILLTVSGGDIDNAASALGPSFAFYSSQSGSSLTAIIVGDIVAGDLMTIHVPDVGAASSYTATAVQIAARSNALRSSLSGYELTVSR